ncbi:MAG: hypothetical protein AB3N33_11840 [Puniceicoccaceae bacterium]
MKNKLIKVLLPLALLFSSSLMAETETPNQAAAAILSLLEEKNYDSIFTTRYTEWYKVEAAGVEPAVALEKFSKRWEKQYDMLISVYQQLKDAEFQFESSEIKQPGETGRVAVTTVKLGEKELPFKLFEMENGTWGFHQ